MTSVLKKSRGTKGKSESMQEDLPSRWIARGLKEDAGKLIKYIDDNVIGKENSFCGPFGRRKVVYCDYSGSGRSLQWLEDYVTRDVLPRHATRCSALSVTSGQTEVYRSESKEILRTAVGAGDEDVVVIGASLTQFLRALRPENVVVFVSSRETERQLTPWKEFGAEIIKIPETKEGFIDLNNLEMRLQENTEDGKRMIGFFPAASKLTGVLADDVATTLLLHQYGAWSFWDYTLVAPTCAVDMNPTFLGVEDGMVNKDALFYNCEKFVGGIQGPYITVVKKHLFTNTAIYHDDVEVLSERISEYKCTEAVRAAIVMQIRDGIGLQNIADRQDHITKQVLSHIKNIPELILLGSESRTRRLPIFSLMVKHPRGIFLHHNFICAVLNDVFGIQARGGLSGDLNYGSDILGIDDHLLKEYEKLLDVEAQKEISRVRKLSVVKSPEVPIHNEPLRPGFCRLSLPFFMSENELAFVLEALKMVATEGWKILPQYVVNSETGQWRHHSCSVLRDKKSLYSIRFNDGKITANERRVSGPGIFPQTFAECLQTARNLFNRARKLAMKCATVEPEVSFNPKIDYLRWFMLPKEAHDLLLGKSANVKHIVPFDPVGYTGTRKSLNNSRSSHTSSPVLGTTSRHFSLSAIDDCHLLNLKQRQKFFSRESSLKETTKEKAETMSSNPVQFAVGESVSPLRIVPQNAQTMLGRSRCYSLGSDLPPVQLSARARLNLGLKETPGNGEKTIGFCNCGSQTDLPSLDDMSPTKKYPYSTQSSSSISDCSQVGRTSPTTSVTSHTSEDLEAIVKVTTNEIATQIRSQLRGVISKVDDILENSDSLEQSNMSMTSISSQSDKNSVSVVDVAELLIGMSREIASEVKHEFREMVNTVDEMISPELSGSRRSSPPQTGRRRIGSGPELGLDLNVSQTQVLKKCPTSPVLPIQYDDDHCCKRSPGAQSPLSAQNTPSHEASAPNSISFNSSETSTPDTIVQVMTSQNSPILSKSSSANKLSDDETCTDPRCRHYCIKKNWCQNPSISSQDSGINLTFTETDSYMDFDKWRTSSDTSSNKLKKLQGRLRMCQKYEKSEVPDIIEGVPVCSGDHARTAKNCDPDTARVVFQIPDDNEKQNRTTALDSKRSSRSSNASSSSSRSSGYGTDHRTPEEQFYERSESDRIFKPDWEADSTCSEASLTDFTLDDEGKWHCPPREVWRATVEAIHEYNMVRAGDKILVCLSGSRESVALLHTMHQYQFYARSKGIHFSIASRAIEDDLVHGSTNALFQRAPVPATARARLFFSLYPRLYLYQPFCSSQDTPWQKMEHNIRILRPFIYVRSQDLEHFARSQGLPDFGRDLSDKPVLGPSKNKLDRSISLPCGSDKGDSLDREEDLSGSLPELVDPMSSAREILKTHEKLYPYLFSSLKNALHPLISGRNIDKDNRHRKKSVIQMKNGSPVYDSEEGTEEEPVP
nr:uncharacterized protein LOC116774477 [Danaus plexippus plexippus]